MKLTAANITRQEYPGGTFSEPRIEVVFEHEGRIAWQVFGVSSCARHCAIDATAIRTEWIYQLGRAGVYAARALGVPNVPPTISEVKPALALIDELMEAETA